MDSKKKMIIALSSFAMIILATVVAVVAVLAAQNVTIKSSINVSYTSSEIAGKVTASYQVAGGSVTSIGEHTYTGAETGTPSTDLNAEAIKISGLTKDNKYVDFIFTFTNTGSSEYTATLTLPTTKTNFTASYTVPTSGGATKITDTSFKVAGGTVSAVTYKVRMTISDVSKDATINGTFSWNLA